MRSLIIDDLGSHNIIHCRSHTIIALNATLYLMQSTWALYLLDIYSLQGASCQCTYVIYHTKVMTYHVIECPFAASLNCIMTLDYLGGGLGSRAYVHCVFMHGDVWA
jgi:hypothetical protein